MNFVSASIEHTETGQVLSDRAIYRRHGSHAAAWAAGAALVRVLAPGRLALVGGVITLTVADAERRPPEIAENRSAPTSTARCCARSAAHDLEEVRLNELSQLHFEDP
jgi:hypothetical protein